MKELSLVFALFCIEALHVWVVGRMIDQHDHEKRWALEHMDEQILDLDWQCYKLKQRVDTYSVQIQQMQYHIHWLEKHAERQIEAEE